MSDSTVPEAGSKKALPVLAHTAPRFDILDEKGAQDMLSYLEQHGQIV